MQFITTIVAFTTKFLLDRFQLFVQIILALGLLHLTLYAAADFFLHIQDRDFTFHHRVNTLQPFGRAHDFQQFLLLFQLNRKMARDCVGEFRVIFNLCNRAQDFRRHFLVELHIVFEMADNRARESFQALIFLFLFRNGDNFRFEKVFTVCEAFNPGTRCAFDEYFYSLVRQFQELQNLPHCPCLVDIFRLWLIVARIFLGDQQDLLIVLHHFFQRTHRFYAPDKKRHDHVREDDNVTKRENGQNAALELFHLFAVSRRGVACFVIIVFIGHIQNLVVRCRAVGWTFTKHPFRISHEYGTSLLNEY